MPMVKGSENPVLPLTYVIIARKILVGAARKRRFLLELKILKYPEKGAAPKYILFTHQNTFIELHVCQALL